MIRVELEHDLEDPDVNGCEKGADVSSLVVDFTSSISLAWNITA